MLTDQKAEELQIIDNIPPQLDSPAFIYKKPLWIKDHQHPFIQNKEITHKRYQYIKIGKTFGFETTRYIAFAKGHLFYYDDINDATFKGYSSMENVYFQWFAVKNGRYLLYLTNGSEISYFYFNTMIFWHQNRDLINKYVIQLNFKDNYQILQQIGKGSFSKVFKVKSYSTKKQYAAKMINKKDKHKNCTKSLVLEERKILMLIKSQYVYSFQQIYEEEDYYVFIIQYLSGKDLMVLFKEKKFTEPQMIITFLRKVLEGIKDIHAAHVIHRDLKPQNILVDLTTMKPCIIDFGLSLHVNDTLTTKSYKRCGTMGYMAPEVIQNTGQSKKAYGYKCDMFSFGIIAYMLLLGYNPLKGQNYDQTFLKNKACDVQLSKNTANGLYGEYCFMFLTKLLAKYPQYRYDADQALNSQFIITKNQQKHKEQQQKNHEHSSSTISQKNKIVHQHFPKVK